MKYAIAVVVLWAIALGATYVVVRDPRVLTELGPLFAICMVGSVLMVRGAAGSRRSDR